jgi:hypothetical protein
MPWTLGDEEYESVWALEDAKRYDYFVSRVVDTERVWGLRSADGDWAYATAEDGREVVAVWPHERYAEACAKGPWADDRPEVISLDDWLQRWLPGLERDGHEIAVFPTCEGAGARVTPQRLRHDLEEGLKQY